MKWFVLAALPNTVMSRYAILDHGVVVEVTVSKPSDDADRVDRPAHVRFRSSSAPDVQVKYRNAQEYVFSTKAAGEQARRPTWRRAGRTVTKGIA